MPKMIKPDRKLWCHKCKKEVVLQPKMWSDICPECSTELKPRMAEDFIEVSQEEHDRLWRESLDAENTPERE